MDGRQEHILPLPNNRQLAYAHNGNPSSKNVAVFFPGLFSVGVADNVPKPLLELDIHWISITLPGQGNSSSFIPAPPPAAPYSTYHRDLAESITMLLDNLHPDGISKLFVVGGSYGTVHAQILYGAPYDIFPHGRHIAGCFIGAPFSPFKHDTDYAKGLIWSNWISVGPPSQIIPFRLLQRTLAFFVSWKASTLDGAESLLRQGLFDKMDADEIIKFDEFLTSSAYDGTRADFIRRMAETVMRSTNNWDGFMDVSDVLHCDWGFSPAALDDEHASKPILVVASTADALGSEMNKWLEANYRNSHLKLVPGGHISSLFYQDELWTELLNLTEGV